MKRSTGRSCSASRLAKPKRRRHRLLQLEGELVVLAARAQVQLVAHAPQEVERRREVVQLLLGEQPLVQQVARARARRRRRPASPSRRRGSRAGRPRPPSRSAGAGRACRRKRVWRSASDRPSSVDEALGLLEQLAGAPARRTGGTARRCPRGSAAPAPTCATLGSESASLIVSRDRARRAADASPARPRASVAAARPPRARAA